MNPSLKCLAVLVCAAGCMAAAPVVTLVDETQSSVNFRLCIEGNCDSDTSRVDGTIEISVDHYRDPGWISLHNFELVLLDDLNLSIEIFLGGLDVRGADIIARYGTPGTPQPAVPLSGGNFTFVDVPMDLDGLLTYDAWGTMCAIVALLGIPCTDTIDLGTMGTQNGGAMTGNLAVAGDDITLLFDPDVTVPLDPDQPDIGDVRMVGSVIATGTVPACSVAPGRVELLMVARSGSALDLGWREEPNSTSGYRVYSVTDTGDLPAEWFNPAAIIECETGGPTATSCGDPDALGASPLLYYQVVGVCDDGSEGPN